MLPADPPDLPKTDPNPPPIELTPDNASAGQLAWLGFGLGLGFICFALPAWFLFWILSTLAGTLGIAELLEQTRGLAPTTYGGAIWLAIAFIALMVLIEFYAIFRPKDERPGCLVAIFTRPSLALFFLAIPTWLLVKVDLNGTDIPDVLTTFLLLCSLGYIFVILPIALLAVLSRVARKLWQIGKRSGFRSGVLGTIGIALASLLPLVCALEEDRNHSDNSADEVVATVTRGIEAAENKDFVDGSREALVAISAGIGEPRDKALFDDCVEALFINPPHSGLGILNETINNLARGVDYAVAEQIAQETVIEVCLGHSKRPFKDVTTRFRWLAKQRQKNSWRRTKLVRRCTIDIKQLYYDSPQESPDRQVEFLKLNRALCTLDPIDRKILEQWAIGNNSTEISAELNISAATIRQRKKRALAKLRTLL